MTMGRSKQTPMGTAETDDLYTPSERHQVPRLEPCGLRWSPPTLCPGTNLVATWREALRTE